MEGDNSALDDAESALRARLNSRRNWHDSDEDVERCPDCSAMAAALDEIARLRRWQAEATVVLNEWENVWEAAGRPGRIGSSKAKAVAALFPCTSEPSDHLPSIPATTDREHPDE